LSRFRSRFLQRSNDPVVVIRPAFLGSPNDFYVRAIETQLASRAVHTPGTFCDNFGLTPSSLERTPIRFDYRHSQSRRKGESGCFRRLKVQLSRVQISTNSLPALLGHQRLVCFTRSGASLEKSRLVNRPLPCILRRAFAFLSRRQSRRHQRGLAVFVRICRGYRPFTPDRS
jgi:hypothetical protein